MKRFVGFLALGSLLVMVGCGGEDDDDVVGNPGFILPPADEVPQAYLEVGGVWEAQGPADFTCLGTASADQATTIEITLSGVTEDFQTGDVVDNVDVGLFNAGSDLTGTPVTSTTSDGEGNYSLAIPVGSKRLVFRSTDPEGTRFLDTYLFNQLLEPDVAAQTETLNSVSNLTANALPAFIGVMRTEGLGVLAGAFRDCREREVDGVIATVSGTSCAGGGCDPDDLDHLDGAQTYYFSAQSTSLPVRLSQQPNTNHDGLFVVIELPPEQESFLQVWGYKDSADAASQTLSLLGEIPSPALADSVITASMEPLRTE
jgi:hypothetical protein